MAAVNRDSAHDPRAIANRILDIREEDGQSLTIMQLIKLIYISDGWSLALLGKPLANEAPEAWQYGPVYRSVYHEFSGIGSSPVKARAMVRGTTIPVESDFSDEEDRLLRMVVNSYGKLSAFTLSNLTHQAGTPWSRARERGLYADLNDEEIKTHFDGLKEKRLVKAPA
jgi:uncharacterized phage-associated protein